MKLKSSLFIALSLGLVASCGKTTNNNATPDMAANPFEGTWVDKDNKAAFTIARGGEVNITENAAENSAPIMTYKGTAFSCKTVVENSKMTCADFILETDGNTVKMVGNNGQDHALNYFKENHVPQNSFLGLWNCTGTLGETFALSIAELNNTYTFVQNPQGSDTYNYYVSKEVTVKADSENYTESMVDGSSEILSVANKVLSGKTPFDMKSDKAFCVPAVAQ